MLAIYKKEIRSYFNTLLGWVFVAFNLFFAGWYFRYYGLMQGYPYISYVISGIIFMFICSVPILTMRTFAEETRQKTDQLLYTSPVPVWKIVLGKYLALASLLMALVIVIGIFPMVLGFYGNVPTGENIVSLFGFTLFGLACLAIGVLISSITESQIIAAVFTFFMLMINVMLSGICNLISPVGNAFTRILSTFDLYSYLNYTFYGEFYLPALLYYISLIVICLYLTGFFICKKRWSVSSHGVKKALSTYLGMILVLVVAVTINVLVNMLPQRYMVVDFTANKSYSLTKKTVNELEKIDKNIELIVISDSELTDNYLKTTIESMDELSEHISVRYVSLAQQPTFYLDYTDVVPSEGSVIVVGDERNKVVDYYDMYEKEYEYEFNVATGENIPVSYRVTGYDGEGKLLSAIDYVANGKNTKAYNVVGHGEYAPEQELLERFEKANIDLADLNLLDADAIPDDCECLLILGPLVDITGDEKTMIKDYLEKGGHAAFVVTFADGDRLPNYYSLLEPYNIKVDNGVVCETNQAYYYDLPYDLLPEIEECTATANVYTSNRSKYIYMPYCVGLEYTDDYKDVVFQPLLETTEEAFINNDYSKDNHLKRYYLGVLVGKVYSDYMSRVAVFSSYDFMRQDISQMVTGNNYLLFMDSINQLLLKEETEIIPVKSFEEFPAIMLSENARMLFSILVIGIIPAAFFITGFFVVLFRKLNKEI